MFVRPCLEEREQISGPLVESWDEIETLKLRSVFLMVLSSMTLLPTISYAKAGQSKHHAGVYEYHYFLDAS